MSRRTSEANKAVREAWEYEQQLVLKGKGTRDWTPEQQQSILKKGRAYDDDGKAFEGHHMKSVQAYPDYQAVAGNIQFLTRTEHCDAHGGSFQNVTNGFYDPATRKTRIFGENAYAPCEIVKLSNPVGITGETAHNVSEDFKTDINEKTDDFEIQQEDLEIFDIACPQTADSVKTIPKAPKISHANPYKRIWNFLKTKAIELREWSARHPETTYAIKVAGSMLLEKIAEKGVEKLVEGAFDRWSNIGETKDSLSDNSRIFYKESFEPVETNKLPVEKFYPAERASPKEHVVQEHIRHYQNGKEIIVPSYIRGGKKEE